MSVNTVERPVEKATPAVQKSTLARSWLEGHIKKGEKKVHTELMTVTPELAQMLLERNTENRNVRPAKLAQLKGDMLHNRFVLNGETLKVSKDGMLNDGQHRLRAIIETNKPQQMLIVFGVERDSRLTVDTGTARSAADHLNITGHSYASAISSTARYAIGFERNEKKQFGRLGDISATELVERGSNDVLLQECANYAGLHSAKFRNMAKQSVVGFCFYALAQRNPNNAKEFMESLRTGAGLDEHSPIHILREKLLKGDKIPPVQKIELIFRAWNAWIGNKPIKILRATGTLPRLLG